MNTPVVGGSTPSQVSTTKVGRIATDEQIRKLQERLTPPNNVTASTTPLQAGYMLGIQTVLQLLREGV